MSYFNLSHFLQLWFLPPGLFISIGAFGWIALVLGRRRIAIFVFFVCFAALWLLSSAQFSQQGLNYFQNQFPLRDVQLEFSRDKTAPSALVVLSGGHNYVPELPPFYFPSESTKRRLDYATYVHSIHSLPIIVSGGPLGKRELSEAALMKNYLEQHYKISPLLLEEKGTTTREEAQFMVPLLEKQKIKRIYLITDAWHMPRSMYAFQKALRGTSIEVIAAPMGFITAQSRSDNFEYLPSLKGLLLSSISIHEAVGMLAYHIASLKD